MAHASTRSERDSVLLQQVAIGDYRQLFLELLGSRLAGRLIILAGDEYFQPSIRTSVVLPGYLRLIRNYFLLGRGLVLQPGVVIPAVRARTTILELNPRNLTSWLILILRRVLGRKTILWGHAWPRAGAESKTDLVRGLMRSLATAIVVYTESQKRELQLKSPKKQIFAAPNAMYRARDLQPVDNQSRRNFVYVGRLAKEKKVDLLLHAFARLIYGLQVRGVRLVIVGDGPERRQLICLRDRLRLNASVEFRGHIGSLEELRPIYEASLASISPGGVGLALTQSLGFGVPMIVANRERHGPEYEAVVPSQNSLLFESGNADELASAMRAILNCSNEWITRAPSISADCRATYSAEAMAEHMFAAISIVER